MIHKYIKYVMLFVFALVQMQGYALKKSSKKYTFWDESFLTNFSDYEIVVLEKSDNSVYFFVNGTYFSLTSVLDNNNSTCFSDNANTRRVIYTLKNISSNTITTTGSIGWGNDRKLEISGTNLSVSNIQGISHPDLDIYLPLSIGTLSSVTLPSQGELVFSIPFSSNNDSNVTGTLNLKFGSSAVAGGSISNSGTLDNLSISNTIVKGINKPAEVNVSINPYDRTKFTLKAAAGLSNEQVLNKKFYRNGIEVSPDYVLTNNLILTQAEVNGFSYTNLGNAANGVCTESAHQSININFRTDIPNPGVIGYDTTLCYGSNYTISNLQSAIRSTGGTLLVRYSWEISKDNGNTWTVFGDTEEENPESTSLNNSTLELSNLRESFIIRRKSSEGAGNNRYSYTNPISINVQQQYNINFPNGLDAYYIAEGDNFTIPNFGSINPNLNFEFLNENGVAYTTNTLTNLSKGEYYITIKATTNNNALLPGCEIYGTLKLIVYDLDDCNTVVKRIYAKKVIPWRSLLGVPPYEPELSVNDDKSQSTQLSTVVDVAGLATSGIDLYFVDDNNQLIDIKGKKVTIKLGENYSGLNLAGGTTVTGRWLSNVNTTGYGLDLAGVASSSNYKNVGPTLGVKGGVLDLLRGDNVYEFSFVPTLRSNDNPSQIINGIRIQAGSLLSVANVSQVFHAYIEEEVTVNEYNPCNIGIITVNPPETLNYPLEQKGNIIRNANEAITLNNMADDATWGNYTEVLNVASGLSSVVYPYYAIDDDYKSYAIFNTTVGVLNKQFLNVRLRQLARPGDQVQITLGTEDINVLNLGLLNLVNHKIKFYLGDALVDEQTLDRFKILDLGLLDFDAGQKLVISKSITVPFDRIQLEQWNTVNANLGNQLYIYDIRTNPQMLFEGQTDPNQVTEVCAADYLKISKMDVCTSFDVQLYYVPENGFGEQLRDELGNLMVDSNGNPILSIISEPLPVQNSEIFFSHSKNNVDYFEVNSLYSQYNGRLLMKIQSKRYDCDYGSPQYLRVNLTNCEAGMINPVIKSGVKN